MQYAPISVVEFPNFMRQAEKFWTDADRGALIDYLATNPEAGVIIPGLGGLRKLRWGRAGIGKRGGTRVIYFYHHLDAPLFLLLAYAKASQEDLTGDDKRAMLAVVAALKLKYPARSAES